MGVNASLEADAQLAKGSEPGVSTLDNPAMAAKPVFVFDAFACDTDLDATAVQVLTASRAVVGLVSMQLVGAGTRATAHPGNPRQRIDKLLEHHRVVPVGTGDAEHQRDALAVRDDVALAAELAAIRGVGPCVRAPRGLGTLAPSKLARVKSSWPALRSSASNNMCRRCHTPAACHSRSRRQHVMPLPKPNSLGQGFPGDAGAQHKENSIEGQFIAHSRPATLDRSFGPRQQWLDLLP